MKSIAQILFLMLGVVISIQAVPPVLNYAGQVAVNGEPFDGNGLFKFALVNADGNATLWSNDGTSANGSEPQASVAVAVNGGLYSILLGNTAQQGMGAIDPAVFAQHNEAKLRVWFSDGVNGFQQLSPDRPFASVPYAFSAGTAQSTTIADGSISKSMLGSDVLTDLNATIGINRLSAEVTAKLDQNGTGGSGIAVGSIISFPSGQSAPAGYLLYQRGEPKELVWEEKAPVSVARWAYDGVEVLDGKIYFVGGYNNISHNTAERYDPATNAWESIASMSVARQGVASSVLNGKLYAIGGVGLSSVEVFDPSTGNWSTGPALPSEVRSGMAMTVGAKIYLIGGINASNQKINQVLCFDPSTNQWSAKANMPTARSGHKLVWFENRIWSIGGGADGNPLRKVESYDPISDSWQNETSLISLRNVAVAWVANDKIYVGCGGNGSAKLNSIETYNPTNQQWSSAGNFPEVKYQADAVVLNDKVYVIAGQNDSGFSNKVFAADLPASVAGVYDLYRKDGNASAGTPLVQAEVADGSVTAAKLAPEVTAKLEENASIGTGSITKSMLANEVLIDLNRTITKAMLAQEILMDMNATIGKDRLSGEVLSDLNRTITKAMLAQDILSDLNATIGLDRLSSEAIAELNSSGLEDNSVTMAKLEPQLRADLNKTTARPFGATLANPYGILGTPVFGAALVDYTVPDGKVLVITSCNRPLSVLNEKVSVGWQGSCPIFNNGNTFSDSGASSSDLWSGLLFNQLSGITPVVNSGEAYEVPDGNSLFIVSSYSTIQLAGQTVGNGTHHNHSIPSGSSVTTNSGGWTGYLIDPTKF